MGCGVSSEPLNTHRRQTIANDTISPRNIETLDFNQTLIIPTPSTLLLDETDVISSAETELIPIPLTKDTRKLSLQPNPLSAYVSMNPNNINLKLLLHPPKPIHRPRDFCSCPEFNGIKVVPSPLCKRNDDARTAKPIFMSDTTRKDSLPSSNQIEKLLENMTSTVKQPRPIKTNLTKMWKERQKQLNIYKRTRSGENSMNEIFPI